MKKTLVYITILVSYFIIFTISLSSQWTQLNSGTTGNVTNIFFKDINSGFAVAGGNLRQTTDSGASWFQGFGNGLLRAVGFGGTAHGCAIGSGGYIFTTNGGANWSGGLLPLNDFYSIHFVNSTTAYSVGYLNFMPPNQPEIIYKTTNGGANWTTVPRTENYILYSVHFFGTAIGYACGSSGRILKTDNGGSSWVVSPSNTSNILYGVFAVSTTNAYIVGANSTVLRTTNWGSNWDNLNIGVSGVTLKSVYFTDAQTGYVSGSNGFIWKTTNGGANWTLQVSNVSVTINSLNFTSMNTGYAAGDGGVILKTTNGGVIAINPISTEVPKDFSLYQNYPNPFNPTTNIKFGIPKATNVKLAVYDMLGREVETLVNQSMNPGTYEVRFNSSKLSSGIYFYKLITGDFVSVKKMSLIK